jgi:hypothetical protein
MEEPPMKTLPHEFIDREHESVIIRTTLYDLIEAMNSQVPPEEDALVVAAVVDLFKSGRARFVSDQDHYN